MSKVKYISFVRSDGIETAVMFGNTYRHVEMANRLIRDEKNLLGAGFVRIGATEEGSLIFEATGEAISLNVKSRPEDSRLLNLILYSSGELASLC